MNFEGIFKHNIVGKDDVVSYVVIAEGNRATETTTKPNGAIRTETTISHLTLNRSNRISLSMSIVRQATLSSVQLGQINTMPTTTSHKTKPGAIPHERPRQPTVIAGSIVLVIGLIIVLSLLGDVAFAPRDFDPTPNDDIATETNRTVLINEMYKQWVVLHQRQTYEWQRRSTTVLFCVSVLITVVGIGFSFWHFLEGTRAETMAEAVDELQIKSQFISLAFKSRSLATFMMCVSIAYFLIYIQFVYPIRESRTMPTLDVKQPDIPSNQPPASTE